MHSLTLKAKLVRRDIRHASIAEKLKVSRVAVTRVIHGLDRSARIEEAIATLIGEKPDHVFPVTPRKPRAPKKPRRKNSQN